MLTVVQVAYPFALVGPDSVGGAEQILHQLDLGLVRAGHRSIVIAPEGSKTAGELVATRRPGGVIDATARKAAWEAHRRSIDEVLRSIRVDVVHFHGIDFAEYLPDPGPAMLATLHLPIPWYAPEIFRDDVYLNAVSHCQRATCGDLAEKIAVIRNGIALEQFEPHAKRRYAACLGRVCPEKGLHLALDATRLASMPLALAGEVFPFHAHQRYFRQELVPRLDRHRRFLGPLNVTRKRRLLGSARCVLMPSLVAETSSLVTMEALASGTPVIAFRNGALPELIEEGRTGFIVDSVEEMAEAIPETASLSPEYCRATARRRFSAERMTRDYLRLYGEIAGLSPIARNNGASAPSSTRVIDPRAMSIR